MSPRLAPLAFAILVLSPSLCAQGSATPYGSGCGGLTLSFLGGAPVPGGLATVVIAGIPAGATPYLLVGTSNTSSAFGALPLALPHPPFLGGCILLTSAEILAQLPSASPSLSVAGVLPPGAVEAHLYLQAMTLGPGSTLARTSAGIDLHIVPLGTGNGDVGGTVSYLATGSAATDARMTLFKPDLSFFRETRTTATGDYLFPAVPAGGYRLGVATQGSEYVEVAVTIAGGLLDQYFALVPETHPGSWSVIGNTLPETLDATDIGYVRTNGTVLYCHDTTDPILFDPVTGQKTFPPASGTPQGCMNGTHLADGGLLFAGGQNGSAPGSFTNAISWVKRFGTSNQWTAMPSMLAPTGRWYPGLARLADGRVLVFGGGTAPSAERTDTAEIFDPATLTWTWTGKMGSTNEFAPAALLYNGKVLRTWGTNPELFNSQSGTWTATGGFVFPNRGYPGHSDHSLVLLTDGRAVAMGVSRLNQPQAAMTEFYDPATGSWSTGPSPNLVRMQGEVVYLPDGHVFFGGGDTEGSAGAEPNVLGIVRRCDLFDPLTSGTSWRRVADMPSFREYHGITLLMPDGRVTTTGGTTIKFQVGPTTADIEAWSPPYLFRGVRPQLSNLSDAAPQRGQTVTFDVFPQTTITSVVLMGLPSTTHWVDGGVPRRLELPVTQTGAVASAAIPSDPNLVPLGWYLLFGMVDDIPAKALIVRVDP